MYNISCILNGLYLLALVCVHGPLSQTSSSEQVTFAVRNEATLYVTKRSAGTQLLIIFISIHREIQSISIDLLFEHSAKGSSSLCLRPGSLGWLDAYFDRRT